MEKKRFLNPKAEVINFSKEDIILTSDVGAGNAKGIPEYPAPPSGFLDENE